MCLDLNKLVLFGNVDGTLRSPSPEQRKTYLSFVDGIIGGQGDGPMDPDPMGAKMILFGTNPVSVDAAAAVLMGFDTSKIPIVWNGFHTQGYPLANWEFADIRCISNEQTWNGTLEEVAQSEGILEVKPHFGWVNHIEAPKLSVAASAE